MDSKINFGSICQRHKCKLITSPDTDSVMQGHVLYMYSIPITSPDMAKRYLGRFYK